MKKTPVFALATVALVVSLLFFVPLAPLLGSVLGVIALRKISRSDGRLGGGALAATAIALGAFMTIANIGFFAAFAIPEYFRSERLTRHSRGTLMLAQLQDAASIYARGEGKFPVASTQWTPIELCSPGPCAFEPAVFEGEPWTSLGGVPFIDAERFYHLRYESDGRTMTIDIRADIDGDGIPARRSLHGRFVDGVASFETVDETPGEF